MIEELDFIYTLIGTPLGYIMWFLYLIVKNLGVSIILFTLIIKLVMMPLSVKQQKNSAHSAIFAPKVKEIQKKYANNKQKQQEELMKLQKEGYNPMGGCAPMLVTMLILFGMIDVIYKPLTHIAHMSKEAISSIKEIAKAAGANIQGLQGEINALQIFNGNPDLFNALDPDVIDKMSSINMNFLGLNLGEIPKLAFTPLIIIPILSLILSFASTMISTKITEKNNPEMNMGSMKIMMYIAPLFSIYLSFILPAGIGFYWIVNYIFGIAQQLLLYKMYNPIKLREQAEAKFKNKIQTTAMVEDIINESADNAENSAPKESLSQKEINRRRLALARKLDAEKYGEEYIEDKDTD